MAGKLAEAITRLEPTAEERAQARQALLALLAKALARLAVTAEERGQARQALLGLPW